MRLAGEQENDRTLRIVDEARQARAIPQQQRRALVGREATRKADRQDVRPQGIEKAGDVAKLCRAHALARVFALQALADAGEHARFHRLRRRPEAVLRHGLERAPECDVAETIAPAGAELRIEEVHPRLVQEGGHVHAVGHEADGILLGPDLRPLVGAQAGRDDTVDAADTIDVPCAVQGQPGHVEQAGRRRSTRKFEEALDGDAELADEIAEVPEDEIVPESIVARGYGRMRREHAGCGDGLERAFERKSEPQMLTQQLQDQERCVTFVEVPDRGLQTQCAQRAGAAEAEDHLLPYAGGLIATVEAVRDVTIGRSVFRSVGVEQVDGHATDLRLPQARDDVTAGYADGDFYPLAAGVARGLYRQIPWRMLAVFGVLDTIVIDRLREVALLVKKPDSHEIRAAVTRSLAVIAGKNPEAAGINGKALVKAVLGAEIGHQRLIRARRGRGHIGIERLQPGVVAGEVQRVEGGAFQARLGDTTEEHPRIAARLLP